MFKVRTLLVSFVLLGASLASAGIVNNGDFESDPLGDGWTQSSDGGYQLIDDFSAYTGGAVPTNSAFLGGYDSDGAGETVSDSISQTVEMPIGGEKKILSFDLTIGTVDITGFDYLYVYFGGTELDKIDLGDDDVTDLFYYRMSYDITSLATPGKHELMFKTVIDDIAASEAFIDNVEIALVPEPATMAALGLGLVALARRRRH